jgi:hypothetical protein
MLFVQYFPLNDCALGIKATGAGIGAGIAGGSRKGRGIIVWEATAR